MRFPVVVLAFALVLSATAQRTPKGSGGIGGSRGSGSTGTSNFPGDNQQSSFGNQSISVRIVTEDHQSFPGMVRVELTNMTGANIADTVARDGMAELPNVPAGSYRLKLSSPDIQDVTTDTIYLSRNEKMLQFVSVKLRESGRGGSTQGTVSANELNAPEKAKSERRKGDEQLLRGDLKKAIEHLNKAVTIYPKYASAYNDLGYAYVKLEDTVHSREAFQKAVEFDEHTGSALLNLARFTMRDGDYPETIRLLSRSLSLGPNNPEALVILANCQYATGQYASAVANARKVHGLPHERWAITHIIAAMALESEQKPGDAALEYETFLKEDPSSARAAEARRALARLSTQAHAAPDPKQ